MFGFNKEIRGLRQLLDETKKENKELKKENHELRMNIENLKTDKTIQESWLRSKDKKIKYLTRQLNKKNENK